MKENGSGRCGVWTGYEGRKKGVVKDRGREKEGTVARRKGRKGQCGSGTAGEKEKRAWR